MPKVRSRYSKHWPGALLSLMYLGVVFSSAPAQADVTIDGTLSTNVSPGPIFNITGGERPPGSDNLFHSFDQFSLTNLQQAIFQNPTDIQNIFARVTGGNLSSIDGLIEAQGNANLFLINPAGISFGPNAQLQIGGSFFASTASSVLFNNGVAFTQTSPVEPLLMINSPIGLDFSGSGGAIAHQTSTLAVPSGRTLGLLGRDVTLDGGTLEAPNGRIELGAVSNGTVALSENGGLWQVSTPAGVSRGDLTLTNGAIVQVDDPSFGGGVQLQGGTITLNQAAQVIAETTGSNSGGAIAIVGDSLTFAEGGRLFSQVANGATGNGAAVNIQLTGNLNAAGIAALNPLQPSGIRTNTRGAGLGGEISIQARNLELTGGATLETRSQSGQAGGQLHVEVADTIRVSGDNPVIPAFSSGLVTVALGSGAGGKLATQADTIEIREGAFIGSLVAIEYDEPAVINAGMGQGGDVSAIARRQILVSGADQLGLGTTSQLAGFTIGSGDAGDVLVAAPQIRLQDGGAITSLTSPSTSLMGIPLPGSGTGDAGDVVVIASEFVEVLGADPLTFASSFIGPSSLGAGAVGNLTLTAPRLSIREGGQVNSTTLATGDAGSVVINAGFVEVSGREATGEPSELSASAFQASPLLQFLFALPPSPTGNIGTLTINSDRLVVTDGGLVTVQHDGTGSAGTLQINASEVFLDRGGTIDARTISGEGGNIDLKVGKAIVMRRGSLISAEAGGTGNGGNITINAPFIVAVPGENSDIIANAVRGNGGNITITTQGILGLEFRDNLTPFSDITASSQFGVSGTVTISSPNVNPTGLEAELESGVLDPNQQVDNACEAVGSSTFTVTGRGGLPDNPTNFRPGQSFWTDTRDLSEFRQSSTPVAPPVAEHPLYIEATGMRREANGAIVLFAEPNSTHGAFALTHCETPSHTQENE